MAHNQGFSNTEIEKLKAQMAQSGKSFLYIDEEELSSEMAEFMFIGQHNGKPVVYDCLLGTLRMAYESRLDEMAERKALEKYPEYKGFDFEIDAEGNAIASADYNEEIEQYKAYCMYEIEDAGLANVAESVEVDSNFEYGVGLEAYLNVPEITESVIEQFIKNFNLGTLALDSTLYSFETEDDDED